MGYGRILACIKKKAVSLSVLIFAFILMAGCGSIIPEETDQRQFDGFRIYLGEKEFSSILDDGDYLYAGGVEGLYRIKKETGDKKEIITDNPLQMVRAIVRDDEKKLIAGHHNGICVLEDDRIHNIDMKSGLPDNRINDIKKGVNKNELWVSTYSGAAHYLNGEWKIINTKNGLLGDIIFPILVDSRGCVWFGGYSAVNSGVSIKNDNEFIYFTKENGLINNSITSFAEDKKSRVWVGTGLYEEGGANLFEFKDGNWGITETVTFNDGLAGEKVRNIYIDTEDRIWFCSEYDGIAVFNPDSLKRLLLLNTENGLSDNEIKRIFQDENGDYWLAARRGITFIEKNMIENMIVKGEEK